MEKKEIKEEKKVSEKKTKTIDELTNLMKNSNSIVIVSIKNLRSSQFHAIKKKLRDNAVIKVAKKGVISRVIDKIEKGAIKNFKKYLKEDQAFIFSKLDPFELSAILSRNKSMAKARIGQSINEDIVVEPGPTELVPGPIISELGAVGLKFSIENGKINIRERKVILKAGEKVSEAQASIMAKLDMKPVAVGLEPVLAYDAKEDKIYEDIIIDQEKTLEELKSSYGKALAFAVKIAYACKDTIGFLIAKANAEEKTIEKLIKEEGK
jgi:large subunit ribosomal protein L10